MPSSDDRFTGSDVYIHVNPSGGKFHLYREGDVSEINITDIASALSRQCRFTGHLLPHVEHYSVAEHCVLVSYILEKMGASADVIFQGLMHDATEAYLSDIAAPFKRELGQYYEKERLVQERINKRYNMPPGHHPMIKTADWYALFMEARQIILPDEDRLSEWVGYSEYGEESKDFEMKVACWRSPQARVEFLARFAQCIDKLHTSRAIELAA